MVGYSVFEYLISKVHSGQILYQAVVLNVPFAIYVSETESGLPYIVVVHVPLELSATCLTELIEREECCVAWENGTDPTIPLFA